MNVPYTLTPTTISTVVNSVPKVIAKSHPNFEAIKKLLISGTATDKNLTPLLDIPQAIEKFTGGNVKVIDGKLFYKGFEVKNALATLILKFIRDGKRAAAKPFERFLEKAFENPDPRASNDLYDWVVASNLPITPDGNILAWKAVREDYTSLHHSTKKFDHRIGKTVEQDRHLCDANPEVTCSTGLHFCGAAYLKSGYAGGGSRIVALEIDPRDVVAFPTDYNLQKGRACRYKVVGEVPLEQVPEFYPSGKMIYSGFKAAPAKKSAGC